ncbi:hypothetical protein TRIP_B200281 [uncultured Desulfatiglans sp.]|nr:hypothetical protein TRIP_B200281 [uncultured Desulfatiglans sp.]
MSAALGSTGRAPAFPGIEPEEVPKMAIPNRQAVHPEMHALAEVDKERAQ